MLSKACSFALWPVLLSLLLSMAVVYNISDILADTRLFGIKTNSLFDLWTIQHFMTGVVLAAALHKIEKFRNDTFKFLLLVALSWELLELSAEIGLLGTHLHSWFYGTEHAINRLIVDPASLLLGGAIYIRFPKTLIFSVTFVVFWLFFNIMSSNSIYIQAALFS